MHYARWYKWGDPLYVAQVKGGSASERFWHYVDKTDGCWLWTGLLDANGYGRLVLGHNRWVAAHRFAFYDGPPPKWRPGDTEIDHLCRVRHCVNPAHMEEVTHLVNMQRSTVGQRCAERQLAKTHCPQGHPYDEKNTYVPPGGGRRDCRTCAKERAAARYRREKLARS